MSVGAGRVTISRFSSDTEDQKQEIQETEIFCVLQIKHFKVHEKVGGSTGLVEFFCTAMFILIAYNISNKVFDLGGTLFQRLGTTLKICKM